MDVSIAFDYKGHYYTGHFTSVSGAGKPESSTWHLMIDGFYNGQFQYTETNGWMFTSQTREFEDISWWFEFYMVSFFQ